MNNLGQHVTVHHVNLCIQEMPDIKVVMPTATCVQSVMSLSSTHHQTRLAVNGRSTESLLHVMIIDQQDV